MTQELFYTSAPKGLAPGSQGFCTVAATAGFPATLMQKVEALSGYRSLYPPHDPQARLNPVVYSHVRVSAGGKSYHVLSRICAAGLDYTQRSNKFAHHLILENHELTTGGPAWLLFQPGFLEQEWDGQVRTLPEGRLVPRGDCEAGVCKAWQAMTGDAGWAGVLAQSLLNDPERPVYLLFEPGMDLLPLLVESLALLPPAQRWEATFSTYFAKSSQGVACACRGVLVDSAEAKDVHRLPDTLIINLRANLGQATGGPLVERARTGKRAAAQGELASPPPLTRLRSEKMRADDFDPDGPRLVRPEGEAAAWPSRAGRVAALPVAPAVPPPVPIKRSPDHRRATNKDGWLLGFAQGTITGFLLSLGVLTGLYFLSGFTLVKSGTQTEERLATLTARGPRVAQGSHDEIQNDRASPQVSKTGTAKATENTESKSTEQAQTGNAAKAGKEDPAIQPSKSNEEKTKKEKEPLADLKAKVCDEPPAPQEEEEKLIASFDGTGAKCKFISDNLEFMYDEVRAKLLAASDKESQIMQYEIPSLQQGPEEIARFSMSARGISLKWSTAQSKAALAARKHLRNGLLEITSADGDKSYWTLRRPVEEDWTFGLSGSSTLTKTLVWKDQERPGGALHLASPGISVNGQPISFRPAAGEQDSYEQDSGRPITLQGAKEKQVELRSFAVKLAKDGTSIVMDLVKNNPSGSEVPATTIWPKLRLDSLELYTEVKGIRVVVMRFNHKGKAGEAAPEEKTRP